MTGGVEPARAVETGRNQAQGGAVDLFPVICIYVLQTELRSARPKGVLFCVYLISWSFCIKKLIPRMNEMTFLCHSAK